MYEDLWEYDELADIVFLVGEEPHIWRIAAHKLVLSKMNLKFRTMLYAEEAIPGEERRVNNAVAFDEKMLEIRISDVIPESFDHMLKFIYTNYIEIETIESALAIYQAATRFEVVDVRKIAIEYFINNTTTENMFDVYIYLEESIEEEELFDLQLKFIDLIDGMMEQLIKTNGFLRLRPTTVYNITLRPTLKLSSEDVLLRALFQWSISECKRKQLEVNNVNRRRVLKGILSNIRFKSLPRELLHTGCYKGFLKSGDWEKDNHTRRKGREISVVRFTRPFYVASLYTEQWHIMSFESDRNIILTAIGFVNSPECFIDQITHFKIAQENKSIIKMENFSDLMSDEKKMCVKFPYPLYIKAKQSYAIIANFTGSPLIVPDGGVINNVSKWNDGERDCYIEWSVPEVDPDTALTLCEGNPVFNFSTLNSGQLFELRFFTTLRSFKEI